MEQTLTDHQTLNSSQNNMPTSNSLKWQLYQYHSLCTHSLLSFFCHLNVKSGAAFFRPWVQQCLAPNWRVSVSYRSPHWSGCTALFSGHQVWKIQLHSCRWLETASTVSEQSQPAQDAQVECETKSQWNLSPWKLSSVSNRMQCPHGCQPLGESVELTCSMFVLCPNGFLIHSKLVSNSGKYIPSCELWSRRCCLKDATLFPTTSSPAREEKVSESWKIVKFSAIKMPHHNSILRRVALILSWTLWQSVCQVCQLCEPLEIIHSVIQFITMFQVVSQFKKTGENFSVKFLRTEL